MEIIPAPKSLQEWRYQKPHPVPGNSPRPRNVWIPLEPFFLSQGYTLWQPQFAMYPMPPSPNDAPRAPDGFVYRTVYCETEPNVRHFDLIVSQSSYLLLRSDSDIYLFKSTIHCPARTTDNRDVLIRLMAILAKTAVKDIAMLCLAWQQVITHCAGPIMLFLSCES